MPEPAAQHFGEPAQQGMHPSQQFPQSKGFGYIVIRPQFQSHHLVNLLTFRGQHQDGQVARLRNLIQFVHDLEAVHVRHVEIEEDQAVGRFRHRRVRCDLQRDAERSQLRRRRARHRVERNARRARPRARYVGAVRARVIPKL